MIPLLVGLAAAAGPDAETASQVLDELHRAATRADAHAYFELFAPDAVFVGTDAGERWDMPAFRAFAEPHFEEAPAWDYTPVTREVHLDAKRRTAWFYETLSHERYGSVRGSGVLTRHGDGWRVSQYVLSFPIPNERARDVLAIVDGSARLPTPFTAAQLRDAHPPGRVAVYRHNDPSGVRRVRNTVVSNGSEGLVQRSETLDPAGAVVSTELGGPYPWEALRDHASFPAGRTTHEPEALVTLPFGEVHTRRYVVHGEDGEVRTFWFDPSLPGPPVRMTIAKDGDVVFEMLLVERG
jgi:hypothetical protein